MGGRARPALQTFLDSIPIGASKGVRVASFDTRFEAKNVKFWLKMLMKMIDFAVPKIAKLLVAKGGRLAPARRLHRYWKRRTAQEWRTVARRFLGNIT